MRRILERISRRSKGIGYNPNDITGSFGLFYEEVGKLPKVQK